MCKTKRYKTIVLSDIHLGSRWSKVREVTRFLKENSCETLILCGDIIDGWALMRGRRIKWRRRHTKFIQLLLEIQYNTRIVYIRGNHDDFLDRLLPLRFAHISLVKDYIHESGGKRFYVLHGDLFDHVTSSMSWLARIGDVGYTLLLWINKRYNQHRLRHGLPYYSISQQIKNKVKASVSYISDFEKHIVAVARQKECQGVICGHIHHPEKRYYGDLLYLNSGDWVESLSALTEDYDGNWEVVYYTTPVSSEATRNAVPEEQSDTDSLVPAAACSGNSDLLCGTSL